MALWVVLVLALVGGTAMAQARDEVRASHNRMVQRRAEWAREACLNLLAARVPAGDGLPDIGRVLLGGGAWCSTALVADGSVINLNRAPPGMLRSLLGSDTLTDALLDWRDPDDVRRPAGAERAWYRSHGRAGPRNGPLADVQELLQVRGFDSAAVVRIAPLVSVTGEGVIDLNAAPLAVLALLPGMRRESAEQLARLRRWGVSFASLDDAIGRLPPAERRELVESYSALQAVAVTGLPAWHGLVVGGVEGSPVLARDWVSLVRLGRVLVVRERRPA